MQQILLDEYFWLCISFLIFAGILWRFGMPAINAALDKRIAEIKEDLETAESLRVEAQEMLAQYQRKQKEALKDAEKIIANAKISAKQFQEKIEAEATENMVRKEQQLQERLKRMEENALQDIQSRAAQIAIAAVERIIAEKLDKKAHTKLVEQSIADIKVNIH